ncbi:MAG: HAMP domain-containing histidine kinase [Bryobacterales bacterium]|nr:HAMP domain-containing histidine kinase [Bryobacterales bacterium]
MHRSGLRNRLVLAFLVAVLAPLGLTLWVTMSLLERSLSLSSTGEVERLAQSLETTGRELYRQARENLHRDAAAGRAPERRFSLDTRREWPEEIIFFWESPEKEQYRLAGTRGDRLQLLLRRDNAVLRYEAPLGPVRLQDIEQQIGAARVQAERARNRDLRRGYQFTLIVLAAAVGVVTLAVFVFFAHRVSRPIQTLTNGLRRAASGDLRTRLAVDRRDEIGRAFHAFNEMAAELEHSRDRLVFLTRLASWQALGRKMAHEVKNSLTPIRLAVEEIAARQRTSVDRAFFEQASAIIVEEVTRLEKRVRAFSDLAAEPPVTLEAVELNAVVEERIGLLRGAHPEVLYQCRLTAGAAWGKADQDLVRGILTNLLENGAEAAGPGGVVLAVTRIDGTRLLLEVHDSGPGLSLHARETLFEPTISFKKTGMGLGLSIARKSALLCGGDLELIPSELGGAGFRLTVPVCPAPAAATSEGKKETAWAPSAS